VEGRSSSSSGDDRSSGYMSTLSGCKNSSIRSRFSKFFVFVSEIGPYRAQQAHKSQHCVLLLITP
jgi:hypothetical protein